MVRILILTAGTHGDVVPFIGLGQRLVAAGHEATIAATATSEHAVTSAGVRFHELPSTDPREVLAGDDGSATKAGTKGMLAATRIASDLMRASVPAMVAAARDADVVLATTGTVLLASPIAEAHGLPCVVLALQPTEPTRTHGPVLMGGRNLGPWLNLAVPKRFVCLGIRMFAGLISEVRRDLDLPAEPSEGYRPEEQRVLHGISPTVYPRPSDWRAGLEVTGYWWPPSPEPTWAPDPALADFLAGGPPPVYFGFGSMGSKQAARLSRAVSEAIERTGCRAIVSRGWADLSLDLPQDGSNVLVIDEVPHEWLFPRVAAVVHHAGAGTTAAGLRAGVPAVPVPFAFDQPFWARRLHDLGVAPRIVPARRVTGKRLAAAIEAALRPDILPVAADLARTIAREDGADRVLELLDALDTTHDVERA